MKRDTHKTLDVRNSVCPWWRRWCKASPAGARRSGAGWHAVDSRGTRQNHLPLDSGEMSIGKALVSLLSQLDTRGPTFLPLSRCYHAKRKDRGNWRERESGDTCLHRNASFPSGMSPRDFLTKCPSCPGQGERPSQRVQLASPQPLPTALKCRPERQSAQCWRVPAVPGRWGPQEQAPLHCPDSVML